jgi:hypothetical protein
MRLSLSKLGAAALVVSTIGLSAGEAGAQERPILSSEVGVASDEATLLLEFSDGGTLEVSFEGGQILVDGDAVGEYQPGEALDVSWRSLLGQVISLRDQALAEALVAWAPPEGISGAGAEAGLLVDRALETALTPTQAAADAADEAREVTVQSEGLTLRTLLSLVEGREGLLEGLDAEDLQLRIGSNVVVEAGESVDGGLVVVGGNLDIYGTVAGDAVVVGGTAHIYEGGRVEGDLHLADSRFFRDGGVVEGTVRTIEPRGAEAPEVLDRAELVREIRDELARPQSRSHSFWNPFRNIGEGIAGIFQTLITLAMLALAGLGMLYFFPDRLEVISDTIHQAPARSAAVGVASGFLLLPAYLLGIVVLAVSIVGIPVLLAWIPLFPLLALLGVAVGYAGVARNLGRWISEREIQGTDWIKGHSAFSLMLGGIGALLLPFFAANVIHMAGDWLGFLEGLLTVFGVMATVAAVVVGFGAVVLTRGGRRSAFADGVDFDFDLPDWTPRRPWRTAWEDAQDVADNNGTASQTKSEEDVGGSASGEAGAAEHGTHGEDGDDGGNGS